MSGVLKNSMILKELIQNGRYYVFNKKEHLQDVSNQY